jgi:hypothetical protein
MPKLTTKNNSIKTPPGAGNTCRICSNSGLIGSLRVCFCLFWQRLGQPQPDQYQRRYTNADAAKKGNASDCAESSLTNPGDY